MSLPDEFSVTPELGFAAANVPHLIEDACVGILRAQCSCFLTEPRDRACVSDPPIRWKAGPSLSPADTLDSPNRAGRLLTRAVRSHERAGG